MQPVIFYTMSIHTQTLVVKVMMIHNYTVLSYCNTPLKGIPKIYPCSSQSFLSASSSIIHPINSQLNYIIYYSTLLFTSRACQLSLAYITMTSIPIHPILLICLICTLVPLFCRRNWRCLPLPLNTHKQLCKLTPHISVTQEMPEELTHHTD